MAEANHSGSRKLMVQVCNAKNLMPKDGQGTASSYAIVDFDNQRRRTKTIFRDLNPQWDETLEFSIHDDVVSMVEETLELNLYNDKKSNKRSTFLGRVKISESTFFKLGENGTNDVPLVYYPLEKRSVFSQIKGEIGLKVWYIDEEESSRSIPSPQKKNEAPPTESSEEKKAVEEIPSAEEKKPDEKKDEEEKKKKKKKEEDAAAAAAKENGNKKEEAKKTEDKKEPTSTKKEEEPTKQKEEEPPIIIAQQKLSQVRDSETNFVVAANDVESSKLFHKRMERRSIIAYDLVDQMPFLYVRVVKAKTCSSDGELRAKLVIGTQCVHSRVASSKDKEWDEVFAFDKESLNSTTLEVSISTWAAAHTKDYDYDDTSCCCLGTVSFDLQEVPKRVPPDSPLAPQWYSLEGGGLPGNDVMLSVWFGTQADEAFQEAWQSDSGGLIPETRAKVYLSPKLWYLRLTVIQTQDLQLGGPSKARASSELYVKAQLGAQLFKTSRTYVGSSPNPAWNEDLIFVAAEPFEPFLTVTVEENAANSGSSVAVGFMKVPMNTVDKRVDDKSEPKSRWFNLIGDEEKKAYAGRIHVRVCLEGGYHVLDEAAHLTSDVRATAKQLTKPPIGVLEVGIRGACNLLPVKTKDGTRGTMDAYVVAKYGPKWVRTRTILDRFNPRWNEQYTWDVYDPCTVLTIGVFDNGRHNKNAPDESSSSGLMKKDVRLGKLRVRLSTLDTNRVYVSTYSLIVLLPGGAKKMGEVEVAVRFSCSSWIGLIQAYVSPMLPRMHYMRPLGPAQQDILRHNAMKIVTAKLARSEPAMGREVVQFMLDTDATVWSMRRSKANWFRVVGCLSSAAAAARWLDGVRTWAHTPTTVLAHVLLIAIVLCPHLILPTVFMYAFLILVLRFRYRQRVSIAMDPRLSYAEAVGPDELDEEFDGFPSTRPVDQVRVRYDRLRALAGRAQTLLGDVAAQGERLDALFNWKDPRATGIFGVVCLFASLVFYVVPFQAFLLGSGFYYLRHPRFRDDMPSVTVNFFRRLPPQSDRIL